MVKVRVEGMACQHCEARLKKFLEDIPGVTDARVDHILKEAEFNLEQGSSVTDEDIMGVIKKAGFTPIEVNR